MVKPLHAFVLTVSLALVGADGSLAAADAPVALSVRADVEGGTLRVHRTATVPDGSWISFTGYVKVEDERFSAQANVSDWPPGEIVADAHFQILMPGRRQPHAVVARYGRTGERMTGNNVLEGGASSRAAIASTTAVKPR